MNATARAAGALRAMPGVFVLIWSTGFIVARYGMPYAPPFKFLFVRFVLSFVCFALWAWAARVALPRGRAHDRQGQDHGADGGHPLLAV